MKTIITILILAAAGLGQDPTNPVIFTKPATEIWQGQEPTAAYSLIALSSFPNLLVGPIEIVGKTGEITWDKSITPTEAAKQFAEALKKVWPSMFDCKTERAAPPKAMTTDAAKLPAK